MNRSPRTGVRRVITLLTFAMAGSVAGQTQDTITVTATHRHHRRRAHFHLPVEDVLGSHDQSAVRGVRVGARFRRGR